MMEQGNFMDVHAATGLVEMLLWVSLLSEDPHLGWTGWVLQPGLIKAFLLGNKVSLPDRSASNPH